MESERVGDANRKRTTQLLNIKKSVAGVTGHVTLEVRHLGLSISGLAKLPVTCQVTLMSHNLGESFEQL